VWTLRHSCVEFFPKLSDYQEPIVISASTLYIDAKLLDNRVSARQRKYDVNRRLASCSRAIYKPERRLPHIGRQRNPHLQLATICIDSDKGRQVQTPRKKLGISRIVCFFPAKTVSFIWHLLHTNQIAIDQSSDIRNMPEIQPADHTKQRNTTAKSLVTKTFFKTLLFVATSTLAWSAQAGTVSGDLKKWAPIVIDFAGPTAHESDTAPNPFLDYRLTVEFTSPNGNVQSVPGFFAGDGNGGSRGNQWRARFSADQVGQWQYQAVLKSGSEIAINTNSSAGDTVAISGATGEFSISTQAEDAPGFLAHGRLEYTGEHYLKFRDGPYWIKSGTDSPENFLGYAGIDGTVDQGGSNFLHEFATHRNDARGDDPFFSNASSGADSLGITGALNYLSDQGVNSIYFLPMNLGGDGQETYPFVGGSKTRFNKTHYDISKLYQWNQVLAHAQRRGIALNIQLSETEVANERWLDDGNLGVERKLFFRELIARFGYLLAAKWNLGEENDFPVSELRAQASYLNTLDWTKKPIAVHTQINNFRDYEELVGDSLFSASSIQYDPERADEFVETWRKRSADAGRRWVIDMDENTGGISDTNADTRRKQILYDVYFSGGNLEWYYGYHPLPLGGDLTAGDFRKREAIWTTMRHARNFMESQLPFWRMQPADQLVSGEANSFGGAEVFAAIGEIYAIYLPSASNNATLDLRSATGSFSLQWFNPRNGQFAGDANNIVAGASVSLGFPPSSRNDDWVVLVKSHNAPALPDFGATQTSNSTADAAEAEAQAAVDAAEAQAAIDAATEAESATGTSTNAPDDALADNTSTDQSVDDNTGLATPENTQAQPNALPVFLDVGDLPPAEPSVFYSLSVTATDAEGVAPVVTAEVLPAGMKIGQVADGVLTLEWQVPSDITEAVTFELIAIDAMDRNLRTTLGVTIPVKLASTTETPIDTAEPLTDDASVTSDDAGQTQDDSSTTTNGTPVVISTLDLSPIIFGVQDTRITVGQSLRKTIIPVDPEGLVASLRLDSDVRGIELIDNGNGSRDLVWTPNESDIGTHTLSFVATDSGKTPHVVKQLMQLEVLANSADTDTELPTALSDNGNFKPIFVPVSDQVVRQGNTIEFVVNPIDPDGTPPILHVSSPPESATFRDNGDGSRTFSWNVPENVEGEVQLKFIAFDNDDFSMIVEQEVMLKVLP